MTRLASREPVVASLTGRLSRADLLWVANTAHGAGGHWHARPRDDEPDHDHLASPEAAWTYLADHAVRVPEELPDREALAELGVIRDVVGRIGDSSLDAWTPAGRALLEEAEFSLDTAGRIWSTATGWRGFCRDLMPPLVELVAARPRLRRCANPSCRLLFEDGSRNHARQWCDTAGCGNRSRVRRARRRRLQAADEAR